MSNFYNIKQIYKNIDFNSQSSVFLTPLEEYQKSDFSSLSLIKKEVKSVNNTINSIISIIKYIINPNGNNKNKELKNNITKKRVFSAIKDLKNSVHWKKMIKYGGVTSGVFGSISLVYSMLEKKV